MCEVRNRAKTSFFYVSLSLFEWIDDDVEMYIYIHTVVVEINIMKHSYMKSLELKTNEQTAVFRWWEARIRL